MKLPFSKRNVKWLFIALVALIAFQFTSGCFSFRMSKREVKAYFKDEALKPSQHHYEVYHHTINYAAIGADSLPTVIFIHGSPGSWSAFIDFMKDDELLHKVQIVSVDRPGFGHSDFGNSASSLQQQAKMLKPVLEKYHKPHHATILVGHSLGGPVIARLAMDYPKLSTALIMVAPSIDPYLEPHEDWFRLPLHTPFLSWVLPTAFRVSNDEIYYLKQDLEDMLPLWKNITQSVTVIQGQQDNLVDPGNAAFAKKMLINAQSVHLVMKKDLNHFIPWEAPDLIKKAILSYADQP